MSSSSLQKYIHGKIESILRLPRGLLKHPFLVPGGIFHDELWDWDSFWITKGILGAGPAVEEDLRRRFMEHAKGSWLNFFEHQAEDGSVSIMIKSDNADFFGSLAKGAEDRNQAKPVFGQFALEISRAANDFTWMEPNFDGLLRFYTRWISKYLSPCGLLVWGNDVAIGVDNDPATYARPSFSSANLLPNCLFYADLLAAAELADGLGRQPDAQQLRADAEVLKKTIQRECWDRVDGFFYSVDVSCHDHRDRYLPGLKKGMPLSWKTLPLKIKMFTGFLPLWCGIASEDQAAILVQKHLRDEAEFLAPWGLRSLAANEPMYEPETDSANPSNWLGPVWIVASYMVFEGLKRYGYEADAYLLGSKTRLLLERDLQESGAMHECYHPDTGQPNFNRDFLSWNVLALLMG